MTEQPAHVVMTSSGVGSYLAAVRVVRQHGPENVVLLFTDVKGQNPSPHAGEDADNYRFLSDIERDLAPARLVRLNGDEDIWAVFKRRRRIGSGYAANCSYELKQKPAHRWLEENCPDLDATTIHVGIDWTEVHRQPSVIRAYAPRPVSFPMSARPLLDKAQMLVECRRRGLEPPRLYKAGFAHSNCGGFCVKAGKAHFKHLLEMNPERYRYHEEREQEVRDHLSKDVAILQSSRRGEKAPLTLRRFREQLENQTALFDPFDFGGCGCFVDGEADQEAER